MNDLPRTPRTLPCDDEDYIFAFHEDGNAGNNSVGVEIGTTTSPEDCFLPMFDHANNAQKILNFDEALTKRTETEHILHTHDGETHTRQRMKHKRKLYGRKLFSTSHLSNKMKNMKLSPVKSSSTLDKFGWQKNAIKIRKKSYHFLKEDDSAPMVPKDFVDGQSSSRDSPPSRFTKSLFWKKRPTASSSSLSSSTTRTSRVPKLKWNQQMDSISTIKLYPKLSRPSIPTTQGGMELASSDSTASSSCTSRADDKGSPCIAPRLESSLHEAVDTMRVEEENDEEYDSDPEDDMHPDAGSFAFAVGRRCRASF